MITRWGKPTTLLNLHKSSEYRVMNKQEMIEHIKGEYSSWGDLNFTTPIGFTAQGWFWNGVAFHKYETTESITHRDVFPFKPVTSTTLPEGVTEFVVIDKWGKAEHICHDNGVYEEYDPVYDEYFEYDLSNVVMFIYE